MHSTHLAELNVFLTDTDYKYTVTFVCLQHNPTGHLNWNKENTTCAQECLHSVSFTSSPFTWCLCIHTWVYLFEMLNIIRFFPSLLHAQEKIHFENSLFS